MIKSKDLAQMLGVSTATVSLVLNNKPGISDKTRTKLVEEIKSLGYGYMLKGQESGQAAFAARTESLPESGIVRSSNNLGFVLYRDGGELLGENSFFPLILDGIEVTARRHGYNLSILNIERSVLKEQISYIQNSGWAGYVIFATELHKEDLHYFVDLGIPFILFDNYFIDCEVDSVKVNNEQGTYLAAKYLREMGHHRIGYLDSGLRINSFGERRECAVKALKMLGTEDPEKYIYTIGYPHENAQKGMEEILNKHSKEELPTAFLSDNDLVAIGAMRAAQAAGYRVPEDFSFMGFDDRPIGALMQPPLSTIQLPRDCFGAEAVADLIHKIQYEKMGFTKTEINGKLIKRGSVADITQKK